MFSGLTLVNVGANLGERERIDHRPHSDSPGLLLHATSPQLCMLPLSSIPPPIPTIPDADPSPVTPSRWSEAGKRPRRWRSLVNKMLPLKALTCLLALAKASPTPSCGGPLYPGGQASQRKPGLVLMQRTRGKQGWELHWRRKGHGGSEDAELGPSLSSALWLLRLGVRKSKDRQPTLGGGCHVGGGDRPRSQGRFCLGVGRGATGCAWRGLSQEPRGLGGHGRGKES